MRLFPTPRLSLVCTLFLSVTSVIGLETFDFVTINPQVLAENKQHMLNYDRGLQDSFYTLKRLSDKAIRNNAPYSVTSKAQLAPSSNPHDYLSLARYFWPNNSTANGLPYIRRDGHVNPEITTVPDYKMFRTLVREVQILGLGYYFFENETYALKGISRIRAWFLDDSTRMNPHLHFASFIKGSSEGRRQGLIDFSVVNDMFDVLPFLQRSRYWLQSDTEGLQDWFTKYLEWLDTSKHGFEERNSINNHGTYFDVQYMGIALFLKRNDLAIKVAQNASSTRIAAQLAMDGSQPHETARAASWFYSIFNLNGLFLLSALSSRVGVDLYHFQTPDGRGIKKAVDYLLPFARQPQTWPFANIDGFNATVLYAKVLQSAYLAYQSPEYLKASNELLNNYHTNHNLTRLLQPLKMFAEIDNSGQYTTPSWQFSLFSLVILCLMVIYI